VIDPEIDLRSGFEESLSLVSRVNEDACSHCGSEAGVDFDRTLCACDRMHSYCVDCGKPDSCPLERTKKVTDEHQQAYRDLAEPVTHYMNDTPCECGSPKHDPVTLLCVRCDPRLYRVVGYPDEFFKDHSAPALVRVAASRKLASVIAELVAETGRPVEVSLA
jgi:hypothetical protein